jgi:hypothetical protein
MNCHVRNYQLS